MIYATGLVQEKVIAPLNPTAGAAETVSLPEAPGAMETLLALKVRASGFVKLRVTTALVDPAKLPVAL